VDGVLSDDQIDRYSRQIVLPEVGAAGQERLLAASATVLGSGAIAGVAARYLAGAGIGRVSVNQPALADELRRLNPGVAIGTAPAAGADITIAAELSLAALDAVVATQPAMLIATGLSAAGGWLHVASGARGCAACAARAAGMPDGDPVIAAVASSALGALAAVAGLTAVLKLDASQPDVWLAFDAAGAALLAQPLQRLAGCTAPTH
jgi:adenylyltransferase/sulfurtransferase